MNYNHPTYLMHQQCLKEPHAGSITAAAATGGLVGSTFRSFNKAVVFGVAAIVSAAGSGGGCKVQVARSILGDGATVSLCPITVVTTTLAANQITSIVFSTPLTLSTMGDYVCLHGSASAATDITEFGSVIWRFRCLPDTANNLTGAQSG